MRMPVKRIPFSVLGTILLFSVTSPLAAQRDTARMPPPARTAREAMRRFLLALDRESDEDALSFFPREGEWVWVHTLDLPTGGQAVGVWRFRASETERATMGCGPARESFQRSNEGQPPGLAAEANMPGEYWREQARNRFVPPHQKSALPVFVEWRREGGRWVVSSFGDTAPLRQRGVEEEGDVMRRRSGPEPAKPAYLANAPWYDRNASPSFAGHRYFQYGQPRLLRDDELEQIGWSGDIRVYVENGHLRDPAPAVLYFPVSAGNYQPYVTYLPDECPTA